MTPQELKASILQLAMQGKITKQMRSDGSAQDLVKHLFVDKKIIPTDPPFDIPDNWLWIPVGNLGASLDTDSFSDGPFGSNLKTDHQISEPEVRIIQLSNIGEDGWKDKNVKYTSFKHLETVIPRCEVHPGDFVIAKMMPAGRTIQVPDLGTRITLGSDAMKFVPNPILNKQYLLYAMRSQAFLEQVYAKAHGITRVRTTLNGIKSYVLPIPPLAEQKRIVAKIEELLPLIDRYEQAWSALEAFNARFPVDMQKSILQMAIQGKLVPQLPEEGTGEELFRQLQAEKQALIKAGKIKKEKPLPEITEDEIPFDIPDNWKLTKLGNCITLFSGSDFKPEEYNDKGKGTPYITGASSLSNSGVILNRWTEVPRIFANCGDVLLVCKGSGYGKTVICDIEEAHIARQIMAIKKSNSLNMDYIRYFLQANFDLIKTKGQGVIPGIDRGSVLNLPIALPPLAEQKRIVAKLEEILPLCERLK